ncbi:unnamed protein product [Trypanosoma congolense IL3000]|uniref:WGS project CAEQ00000000 data, annotated contig 270 n=1 Tax=Trypanosoma congolense (strain IL3000) TaxID=1068625 RepID=F9WEI1_TRYCI|nr:unnamed protein product [Trypanosoma congolense IL3000]
MAHESPIAKVPRHVEHRDGSEEEPKQEKGAYQYEKCGRTPALRHGSKDKNALPRHCQGSGSPRWCTAVSRRKAPDSNKGCHYTQQARPMKRDHPAHDESLRPEPRLRAKTHKASQGMIDEGDRWRVCQKSEENKADDRPVKTQRPQGNGVSRDFVSR